mmetsp:Transcript_21103/g.48719  ORF Transcript_21103/g.48719 Transcript_21103/m.48719 type:complete len:259 (+) Transcript_21103:309-1085(+)
MLPFHCMDFSPGAPFPVQIDCASHVERTPALFILLSTATTRQKVPPSSFIPKGREVEEATPHGGLDRSVVCAPHILLFGTLASCQLFGLQQLEHIHTIQVAALDPFLQVLHFRSSLALVHHGSLACGFRHVKVNETSEEAHLTVLEGRFDIQCSLSGLVKVLQRPLHVPKPHSQREIPMVEIPHGNLIICGGCPLQKRLLVHHVSRQNQRILGFPHKVQDILSIGRVNHVRSALLIILHQPQKVLKIFGDWFQGEAAL